MAINTAEKRKSISGIPVLMPGVTPNSAKDAEWRQQSGWSYSGIALAAAAVIFTPLPTLRVIESYLMKTGFFTGGVQLGEPSQAPQGTGLFAAITVRSIRPAHISLLQVSQLYVLDIMLYRNMLAETAQETEQKLALAVQQVASNLLGDFDIGATIRNVDPGGVYGQPLTAQWGHVSLGGVMHRVATMRLPLVVNDTADFG